MCVRVCVIYNICMYEFFLSLSLFVKIIKIEIWPKSGSVSETSCASWIIYGILICELSIFMCVCVCVRVVRVCVIYSICMYEFFLSQNLSLLR